MSTYFTIRGRVMRAKNQCLCRFVLHNDALWLPQPMERLGIRLSRGNWESNCYTSNRQFDAASGENQSPARSFCSEGPAFEISGGAEE